MSQNDSKQASRKEAYIAARLAHPGWSQRKLAELLGISLITAQRYSRDPKVKEAIDEEIAETKEMARLARRRAMEKLISHLDSQRAGISLQACKLLLAGILDVAEDTPLKDTKTPLSLKEIAASLNEEQWNQVYEKAGETKEE